jgi:polysaccharide export outer membrane protein
MMSGFDLMTYWLRLMTGLFLAFALGACALPRGGPIQSEITKKSGQTSGEYSVVAISQQNIDQLNGWATPNKAATQGWPGAGRGGTSSKIKPGDRISLTVWENEANALLTPGNQKSVQLANIVVSPTGKIFLPYIGDYTISNQTPDVARAELQEKMGTILTSPQVQISVDAGRQNTVDLVGGVAKPGNYAMPDQNLSVLGLLSLGGGIPSGLRNPQLRLLRGDKVYGTSASSVMSDPAKDALIRGGDKLIVSDDKRYFLALGAAQRQSQIFFSQEHVSALDAMALIGGLEATRANPEAILVLRNYAAGALRQDGTGPDNRQMIFTLDLTSADGLFSAQKFEIAGDDVVIVAESPVVGLRTVLTMIGQSVGLARNVSNVSN